MEFSSLTAISAVDGRYAGQTESLREFFSEYGLIRHRVIVELGWFQALAGQPQMPEFPALSNSAKLYLEDLVEQFSIADARRIKEIEGVTRHDVKAVEYYLVEQFEGSEGSTPCWPPTPDWPRPRRTCNKPS